MIPQELLERLLQSYADSYDVQRPYELNGCHYDAYAKFNVTSAKYVLVKSAELWRADCFEHTFFKMTNELRMEDIEHFRAQVVDQIEPELVRLGQRWTPKNHMYTYVTGIFICEEDVTAQVETAIKQFRFLRNYMLTIRGYCEARLLVFDMKKQRVLGNRVSRELVKGYTKANIYHTKE